MQNIIFEEITAVFYLIAISIGGRAALVMVGQRWIATFAHTATLVTLPIITFIITNVISGNIALSLGMVGALSIVRFRNPVKSPFELSVYFAAITMGIVASVSLNWLALFVFALGLIAAALVIVSLVAPRFTGRPYFETSFSEGSQLSTLEVESREPLLGLSESESLISEARRDGSFTYILASAKFPSLQGHLQQIENLDSIVEARLNK